MQRNKTFLPRMWCASEVVYLLQCLPYDIIYNTHFIVVCLILVEKPERSKVWIFPSKYRLWRGGMSLSSSYEQDIGKGILCRLTEISLRNNSVSSNRTTCSMAGTGLLGLERCTLQLLANSLSSPYYLCLSQRQSCVSITLGLQPMVNALNCG
jgi:hypothetical protein